MSKKSRKLQRQNNKPQNSQPVVTQFSEHFSGPLPHPSIFQRYDQVLPGAAERILQKFEQQTDHRHQIESAVVKIDNIKSVLGLILGFVIAMTTIIGGIYTAMNNHTFLGGSLSFAGLAILVGAFVSNKYSNDGKNKGN